MTHLLTTGINGLVGSKFSQLYGDQYQLDTLDISDPHRPIDITQADQVIQAFASSPAKAVIHLAAYTNVTEAWKQKDDQSGLAYQVNVVGTQNIVAAATKTGKYLIHISTAYVFDGQQAGLYQETDSVNPIEWYGQTKAEAEAVVQSSDLEWCILRIDQPFRSDPFPKVDIAHRIIADLNHHQLVPQFTDHFFGPTYIDDFARVLDWAVRTQPQGLYHASSGEKWSDYQLAKLIQKTHQLPGKIKAGQLDDYLKTLNRPYQRNTAMSAGKLHRELDFQPRTIEQAVAEIEWSKSKNE